MLFGHQNDTNQQQPQAEEQTAPGYMGPQDQVAQTVAPQPQDSAAQDVPVPPAPATQDAPAPQAPAAGVNPLAVDPATGASLPAVPTNSVGPVDTPADDTDEQPSVLNQPSAPSVNEPAATDFYSAPAPAEAPAYTEDAAAAYSGSPFSAAPAPDAAPVMDQAAEDNEASAIAQELDTPGEGLGPVFGQDPGATSAPAADAPADPQPQPAPSYDHPAHDGSASAAPAASHSRDNDQLLELKQQAIAQLSPLVSHLDQGPEEKFRTTMMLLQSTDNPALLHDAYTAAQSITDDGARAQALLDVVNEINYFTQQQDAQAS